MPGAGNKGVLDTAEKKLFFTLFYLKVYPTFRVLGFLFNKPFGKLVAELRLYRQALEQALGYKIALPQRRLQTVAEFLRACIKRVPHLATYSTTSVSLGVSPDTLVLKRPSVAPF